MSADNPYSVGLKPWSQLAGMTGPGAPAPATEAAPGKATRPKRRVSINELLGIVDRFPHTERAQLNMLAPVPIVLRWRQMVAERRQPAWETLEAAMNALDAQARGRVPPGE